MSVVEEDVRHKIDQKGDGFSYRLRESLTSFEVLPLLSVERFYQEQDIKTAIVKHLFVQHSYMRVSVHMMEAALAECQRRKATDKICERLADYYAQHIEEERHHDTWLMDDLESIGIENQQVQNQRPLQRVAEFTGTQYYWIYHYHPAVLLGYIAVLEGYPPNLDMLQNLQEKSGLPETLFRTIRMHGEVDPTHRNDLYELLDSLPLSHQQQELITQNAIYTLGKCAQIIDDTRYVDLQT